MVTALDHLGKIALICQPGTAIPGSSCGESATVSLPVVSGSSFRASPTS